MYPNNNIPEDEMIPVILSASQIGQSWMHIGYRIRGRMALLLGHERGNRVLPFHTRLDLYRAVVSDLEILARSRKEFEAHLPKILKNIEKNRQRSKNERMHTQQAYSLEFLDTIMRTRRTPSDIEYVLLFLEHYILLRREKVVRILFAPKITSLLGITD